MWLKVFVQSRGGTAKASVIVNVSEDIYAGFNNSEWWCVFTTSGRAFLFHCYRSKP